VIKDPPIRVTRLAQFCDPFGALGFQKPLTPEELQDVEPIDFLGFAERGGVKLDYDRRRIKFFIRAFENGEPVDPIEVDNEFHGSLQGYPVVTDGHHRFAAAILTQTKTLGVTYSGRLDILHWLAGTGRKPSYL
jgi:hypothetical protein